MPTGVLIPRTEIEIPCTGEKKSFKSAKDRDMWIKLHKKKCERCNNAHVHRVVPLRTDMVRTSNNTWSSLPPAWDSINAIRN